MEEGGGVGKTLDKRSSAGSAGTTLTLGRSDFTLSIMAELVARDISDDVVDKIRRRALEHGVSLEEEAGRLLSKATENEPAVRAPSAKKYTLFDHFRKLAEIAPDFDFEYERKHDPPRPLDLE
jgi:plasmid stability protein